MRFGLIALCVVIAAPGAAAEPYCWERTPNASGEYYYPRRTDLPDGQVTLECSILADRSLACMVDEERPVGLGYGQHALRLSRQFRTCANVEYEQPLSLTFRYVNEATKPDPSP